MNYNPSAVRQQRFGELWSTSKKNYRYACWPIQNCISRNTTFRPLGGLPRDIFTCARKWPRLANPHPPGMRVPHNNFFQNENTWQKNSARVPITLGLENGEWHLVQRRTKRWSINTFVCTRMSSTQSLHGDRQRVKIRLHQCHIRWSPSSNRSTLSWFSYHSCCLSIRKVSAVHISARLALWLSTN